MMTMTMTTPAAAAAAMTGELLDAEDAEGASDPVVLGVVVADEIEKSGSRKG